MATAAAAGGQGGIVASDNMDVVDGAGGGGGNPNDPDTNSPGASLVDPTPENIDELIKQSYENNNIAERILCCGLFGPLLKPNQEFVDALILQCNAQYPIEMGYKSNNKLVLIYESAELREVARNKAILLNGHRVKLHAPGEGVMTKSIFLSTIALLKSPCRRLNYFFAPRA